MKRDYRNGNTGNKSKIGSKVNLDIYELLKQAAAITGRTFNRLCGKCVAYEEAKKTISEHQILRLTLNDQALLIDNLSKPFEPTQSMKNALDVYEEYLSVAGKIMINAGIFI